MSEKYPYPRRQISRKLIHYLTIAAFNILTDFQIEGRENLPKEGPLLVVANHFCFVDPVAVVRTVPWPMEFVGGAEFPHAPKIVQSLPKLWGFFPLRRGTASRDALRAAEAVLKQDGVLGIFPEGGSWAEVLRPARPGAAYLSSRTGAKILPIALYGFNDIFPLQLGQRPTVHVRIGKPFGPFTTTGRGRERRQQLDEIGQKIMQRIADLLPDEFRGYLSEDPETRAAAKGTEIYPWEDAVEGEVEGEVH